MSTVIPFPGRPAFAAGGRPTVDPVLRAQIEVAAQAALDTADRLIAILNRWDGDPDLEDGADDEPSLAAPEGDGSQLIWFRGGDADREQDLHPAQD